jgi:hypothetical protein
VELPVDAYRLMVKSKRGEEMRKLVYAALEFRRISNASPEMLQIVRRMEEALSQIGDESKLNAVRVKRYGV